MMFEIGAWRILALVALFAVACGPHDAVPSAPTHPANPDAPAGGAHAGDAVAPAEPNAAGLLAAEQAAYARAQPVFETYCVRCHKPGGDHPNPTALKHLDLGTYPFGGHHATEAGKVILEALGASGGKATMPDDRPGAVQGDELERIKAWAAAFEAAQAAGLHPPVAGAGSDGADADPGVDEHDGAHDH